MCCAFNEVATTEGKVVTEQMEVERVEGELLRVRRK